MHRHPHPIPTCFCRPTEYFPPSSTACPEELLAALECQNQLLLDLLGAVNSLTAALLGARRPEAGSRADRKSVV